MKAMTALMFTCPEYRTIWGGLSLDFRGKLIGTGIALVWSGRRTEMKKTALLVAALAVLTLPAFAQEEDHYSGSFIRMTYVKGDVVVQRAGDLGSEAGIANLVIVEGDRLETRNGRAEVGFGKRNYLRADNDTLVEFSNLPRRDDDRVRLHLLSGNIYLRISELQEEKTFEVHTPDASFYVLEEGLYRFDARSDGETELSVLEGSVEAAGEGGSELVGGRERLGATNGRLADRLKLSYGRDDFDNWNEDRDAVLARPVSKRYLPSELDDYESELADNGYWVYERPFGYVWVPYVHSYVDWRPYYYGYWNWYPLCGWTWIPYEPWGWTVYHYGRWGWRLGLGWYWIPHHAWGPAWVHWYWGYDYCGWCPLSWYNYPCVLVGNYFYDRYHWGHYPGGSHALTVIRRDQLQNRHISKIALSREEAGRLGNITLQARQPDVKPVLRSSDLQKIAPSKTVSVQPQIRPSTIGKSPTAPTTKSLSRTGGSSVNKGRLVSGERLSGQDSRVSSGSSSKTRQIRPSDSRLIGKESSSPSTVRSYSPSSRVSSVDRFRTSERGAAPRIYSPSSSISRYGTSYGRSPVRSYGSSPVISRPSSGYASGSKSYFGSSYRSIFSAPKSSPVPRSFGYSSPSISRSFPSYSSGSRSYSMPSSKSIFSAPRSSSSSGSFRFSSPSFSRSAPSSSSGSRSVSSHSSSVSRSGSSGGVRRKN